MISCEDVEKIHSILLEKFGGATGIRDVGLLESSVNRPYQTFDGNELYPTAVDKAAAIFESIISNHPFIDGNKRTAYVLLRLVLIESDLDICTSESDKFHFVMMGAKGELAFDEIREWISHNLTK